LFSNVANEFPKLGYKLKCCKKNEDIFSEIGLKNRIHDDLEGERGTTQAERHGQILVMTKYS
jgi:hypothetical protein